MAVCRIFPPSGFGLMVRGKLLRSRNRKLLEKHFAGLKHEPAPGPEIPRLNLVSVTSRPDLAIPDDLSIPPFLDRRPLPELREAA